MNAKAELCCGFGNGWSRSGANVALHPLTALSFRRLDLELALQAEVLSLQLVQAESPDALTGCCTSRLGCAVRARKAAAASSVVSNVSALAFAFKVAKCAFEAMIVVVIETNEASMLFDHPWHVFLLFLDVILLLRQVVDDWLAALMNILLTK